MSDDRSVSSVGLFPSARTLLSVCFAVPSDISRSGIQLFVLGTAAAALRKGIQLLISFVDRTFIARSEIDSRDEAYHYITTYLGQHKKDSLHFTVSSQNKQQTSLESSGDGSGLNASSLIWLPAPGLHLLFYQSRPILIHRSLNGEAGQSNLLKPSERLETMSIATIAVTPHILHSLIEHARALFLKQDRSRTVVFSGTQYGGWQRLHARPIRPLNTVILSPSILNPLLEDIRSYLRRSTEEWYASRGVPYRRGYLFSGPPGTGKTSLAVGLAGEFKLGVYVVSLSGKGMNDDTLIELLGNMPRRSILLLEDIDVAFPNRAAIDKVNRTNKNGSEPVSGVTSSGLLNALDGVAAQEGRIVILTTNFLDRLDDALIRPGRVDMRIEFTLASTEDIKALFCNFFSGDAVTSLAGDFAARVEEGRFSIAALQGYLMTHKDDPRAAIAHIGEWTERLATKH
ncbi:putative BCS1-like ATPase [Taphrina deformans PYCC 5710]|uniref:BCS1-like ATPase n=1 Tax=Taphrina deformans (strain PYCC 5710 / ATCC 11124 / CBS 356.35 / IMI 108563 / JCM 9778 / NBRC 8474) TaxID=1097556 RepID=S0BE38_TAPDE|nr:putative BCS1-like ATPase [Taphrina deformans PYCC 5710]|eukprot:CCG81549.1 putative BCS1-like ATPase [Taphrina deformans PYCC 5710]